MKKSALVAIVLLLSGRTALVACGQRTYTDTARYDQVFRKACHNCYEKQYSPSLKAALDHTATIEVDIWDKSNKVTGSGRKRRYWYVRHNPTGGNSNNSSTGGGLDACLRDIKAWSDARRGRHEVITLFVDKKEGWGKGRQPADLDALVTSIVPRARIFRPQDLKGARARARDAARQGAWPSMKSLTGKFVFVLTGGAMLFNRNKNLHRYVAARGRNAVMFVAPDTDESRDIVGKPNQFDARTAGWVVFFNVKLDRSHLCGLIRSTGGVSRVWAGDKKETDARYRRLLGQGANFIALYKFRERGFNGGRMTGVLASAPGLHHHHKRGKKCAHGKWATSDAAGHHHHRRGRHCPHGKWATSDAAGHHHHKRGADCEHRKWATDDADRGPRAEGR